jgi:hypothetical protein
MFLQNVTLAPFLCLRPENLIQTSFTINQQLMTLKSYLFVILVITGISSVAQKNLPLIQANSKTVDIRDGNILNKAGWTIVPEAKPDVYTTENKMGKVTFYTDLDSISFLVKPGINYDFNILLNHKDTALTRIVYVPGFLETLKNAARFNPADSREIPAFTYQSSDNPHLQALRKAFNLDSIAGSGTDVNQIINIMHWIHYLVPHDGQHGNPEVKNAMNMIAVCKKQNIGLNCRGLATVLNECYLAMGFNSRFVTCLPKDSLGTDNDCHVINMVFAPSLDKWIWMDPTNDAYVMNENGELLGIDEVRERLISNKTLIVNPDANWNRKSTARKEDYLYKYMAKNLYRIECPVSSEYDTETKVMGKKVSYVQLIPMEYFKQGPFRDENYNKENGVTIIEYKTNNPVLFWAKPPKN